jgi:three-Cys-motif partner protein
MSELQLDQIGRWSEVKLDIIREYAKPYSTILAKQPQLYHVYVDGFAGAGMHVSKTTGEKIGGSPINVTAVEPPFREYHLVELNSSKARHLRRLFASNPAVQVHEGDCNDILQTTILPKIQYRDYRRAFCLLDPYGLHLDWSVVAMAGQLKTVDLLLNFPIMDMNMNALLHEATKIRADQAQRMTRFWGDESWQIASRTVEHGLFGEMNAKAENDAIVDAYCDRLRTVAGFAKVAEPLPMRNRTNAIVYYLIFASPNETAHKIITSIFNRHR